MRQWTAIRDGEVGPLPSAPATVLVAALPARSSRFACCSSLGSWVVVWRLLGAGGLWHRPDSARQVLRERYARGEISEEEYRKRLSTLA